MSAPRTNVEKQKRRHRPALLGIAAVLVFGAIMFLLNAGSAVDDDSVGAGHGADPEELVE